ncbi:SEL1-like repeat protein [Mycoplasmatota bacterium zrk1]
MEGKTFLILKKLADSGHLGAKYEVGLAYLEGDDVKQNTDYALKYFQMAAAEGHEKSFNAILKINSVDNDLSSKKLTQTTSTISSSPVLKYFYVISSIIIIASVYLPLITIDLRGLSFLLSLDKITIPLMLFIKYGFTGVIDLSEFSLQLEPVYLIGMICVFPLLIGAALLYTSIKYLRLQDLTIKSRKYLYTYVFLFAYILILIFVTKSQLTKEMTVELFDELSMDFSQYIKLGIGAYALMGGTASGIVVSYLGLRK